MIYIDPPYNRGHDFIYNDTFKMNQQDYSEKIAAIDEANEKLYIENTNNNPRFHSNWCNMMYPRLLMAQNLLTEDGAIFISIDEYEQCNLKQMLNEIFGESNKVAEFVNICAEGGGLAKQVIKGHEYLYVYAKNISKFIPLSRPKDIRGKIVEKNGERYWIQEDWLRKEFGKYGNLYYEEILKYKGQDKLDEINAGLKAGIYELIPKSNGMHIVGKLRNLRQDASKFYSVLRYLSADGVKDLNALGMSDYFDYPKPVKLIKDMILGMTFFSRNKDDIILDFFSGSATTAQAVMDLNAEDNGHRKFIMVQLPEACGEKSKAYKAGYKTICDIGEERIRRAGEKIRQEHPDVKVDTGFRVFRVDTTNMEDVYYRAGDYQQSMLAGLISNVKPDRTGEDLLFGCLLNFTGITLDRPYAKETCDGCTVYDYDDGTVLACFDLDIPESLVESMARREPAYAIFQDSSFAESAARINVTEIFKRFSPLTRVTVI